MTFKLNGFEDAKEIVLMGSFNHWDENDFKIEKYPNGYWVYSLPPSGGKHHYKYIVDGEWVVDPDNSVMEYDNEGHVNSVYFVKRLSQNIELCKTQ